MKFSVLVPVVLFQALQREVYGEREAVCGQRTERNECCVFPFTYDGKPQHSCIVGGPSNFYWCATTANYDRDGQWDICIGIKCYICTSDVSWSDCKSQQQPHICPYRYDECLTLSKEEGSSNTSKLFQKRCTSNKLCTAYNPTCKGRDVIKCDFSCCMGDLCNKAACFTQNGNFGSLMLSTALFLIIYVLE